MTVTEQKRQSSLASRTITKRRTKLSEFLKFLWVSLACFMAAGACNILYGINSTDMVQYFIWALYGFGVLLALFVFTMGVIMYFKNPDDLISEEHIEEMARMDLVATKDDKTPKIYVLETPKPEEPTQISDTTKDV